MNTELMNELYLLQQSRCNAKYQELLNDNVYSPIQFANKNMTSWVSKRGKMLMKLETRVQIRMKKLKRKLLNY